MSEQNLRLYELSREVPKEAQKAIEAGRLKGKTDINPMWRIKKLTELFGPVGIGWTVKKLDQRMAAGAKDEIAVFVDIELRYRETPELEWSEPVYGTGGAMFVELEKAGLHTDDDAFKKAYTDAISVACKAIGIGADVYWSKDPTKYQPNEKGDQCDSSDEQEQPDYEFAKAEADKMRGIIINLAKAAGRDEPKVRMFAEELVEKATGVFVKFDDMDIGTLTKVKVELAKKIAGK